MVQGTEMPLPRGELVGLLHCGRTGTALAVDLQVLGLFVLVMGTGINKEH